MLCGESVSAFFYFGMHGDHFFVFQRKPSALFDKGQGGEFLGMVLFFCD